MIDTTKLWTPDHYGSIPVVVSQGSFATDRPTDFECDLSNVLQLTPYEQYMIGLSRLSYSNNFSTFLESKTTGKSRAFIKIEYYSPDMEIKADDAFTPIKYLTSAPSPYYLPFNDYKTIDEIKREVQYAIEHSLLGVVENERRIATFLLTRFLRFTIDPEFNYFIIAADLNSEALQKEFKAMWNQERIDKTLFPPWSMKIIMSTDLFDIFGKFERDLKKYPFHPDSIIANKSIEDIEKLTKELKLSKFLGTIHKLETSEKPRVVTAAVIRLNTFGHYNESKEPLFLNAELRNLTDPTKVNIQTTQAASHQFKYTGESPISEPAFGFGKDIIKDKLSLDKNFERKLESPFPHSKPTSFPAYVHVQIENIKLIEPTAFGDNTSSQILGTFPLRDAYNDENKPLISHEPQNICYMELKSQQIRRFKIRLLNETLQDEVPIRSGSYTQCEFRIIKKRRFE